MDRISLIAFNQGHPKKKPIGYQVKIGYTVVFESESAALCNHFKTLHALTKAVVSGKY